jgi:hypothetical protein
MKSPPPLSKYTYVTDTTLLFLLWGRDLYVDSQSWDIQYSNNFQLVRNYCNNEEYTNILTVYVFSRMVLNRLAYKIPRNNNCIVKGTVT